MHGPGLAVSLAMAAAVVGTAAYPGARDRTPAPQLHDRACAVAAVRGRHTCEIYISKAGAALVVLTDQAARVHEVVFARGDKNGRLLQEGAVFYEFKRAKIGNTLYLLESRQDYLK